MTDDRLELSRRKILAGAGAIGLAGAGAGLGTSAYFSDQETFANNQLTAGELDLKVAWQEHYSNWMDDDYGDDPPLGAETKFARMPDSGEAPSFRLPPGSGQPDGRPIELVFEDDATGDDDNGFDSRPDKADGGRQFLRNTAVESANGGLFANNDLCETPGADAPDRPLIDLEDVKPGDFGFGLFRLKLCTNPGYVWLNGELESAMENGLSEPEEEDPDEDGDADSTDPADVELLDAIQVAYGVGTTTNLAPNVSPEDSLLPEGEQVDGAPQPAEQLSLREFLYLLEAGDGLPLDGDIDAEDGGGTGRDCFAGETEHYVSVVWWLPIDHGNEVQTDSVTFDLGFYTEQCRHNEGGDLVAYYPLDSVGDGTAEDLSGRGNDGTPNGGVSPVDGKVGDAAEFDGNDWIQVSDSPSLDGMSDLTVTAWMNFPSMINDDMVVVGKRNGYELVVDGKDRVASDLWWAVDNGDGDWTVNDGNMTLAANTWHHLALVSDAAADEIRLYRDGTKTLTNTGTGSVTDTSTDVGIGQRGDGFGQFNGKIDDVRIYDRVLSDSEINNLADL